MKQLMAAILVGLVLGLIGSAHAAETIHVYGPGGPAPAMKEAAAIYEKKTGTTIQITAGPTGEWIEKARLDADIVFSGSENMMTGFITAMNGQIISSTVEPLFIRPSTILVRKGNPKGISGIRDLIKPGMKVLVVEGAGQVGMWEDVVGRTGDLSLLAGFRRNVAHVAGSSAEARKIWMDQAEIDAWLIWNHWQVANSTLADAVDVEPELRIWRPSDVSLTKRGYGKPQALAFIAFLKSPEGRAIFKKWGWSS